MCQLLALSANNPTDISFSFEGFVNRAGITDTNVDGTGIAFFEDRFVRILKDENRACDSYVRNLVRIYHIKSKNVIAHIRRASQGNRNLVNCHPFARELWNETWVFAHNGHIEHFPNYNPELDRKVVGETDSEKFFVHLIDFLGQRFSNKPSCQDIFSAIGEFADSYAQAGICNFVISNGECLIAHCSTNLYWVARTAHSDHFVKRIDDGGVINLSRHARPDDKVAIVATMPITNEKWHKLENGQLILLQNGEMKYLYNGIPNVINEKYASLTGLSKAKEEEIRHSQEAFEYAI